MTVDLFSRLQPSLSHGNALFHGLDVEPEDARSLLRPQRDKQFGFGYTLSPYRGCGHGCLYCYVREYPSASPRQTQTPIHGPCQTPAPKPVRSIDEWGTWSAPKLNAPELLWRERHKIHNQSVFLATATDPYQPIEKEYRLTRACLEVLLLCQTTKVMIHTRSPLIMRDLDLLQAFGDRLTVGFSIPTDDDTVRQVVEPKAPPIPSRWATIERLSRAGISVHMAVTPLMVMVDPEAFARRAKQSGVSSAWVGALRLLDNDPFFEVLESHGWMKALDPDYQADIRDIVRHAFPPVRDRGKRQALNAEIALDQRIGLHSRPKRRQPPPPPKGPSWAAQPGLFDQLLG